MKKILIVEDDESIGELLRDYLEINGFSVHICTNGNEGFKKINDEEFDLLISQIHPSPEALHQVLKDQILRHLFS